MRNLVKKNRSEILDNKKKKLNLFGSKKGAEMTIGTIVIIVLALVVLVVLVVGFTQGWGSMWTWFTNLWGGGGSNLDAVINGCITACSTKAQAAYCTQLRDVKFGDAKDKNGKYNCKALENENIGLEACSEFSCVPIKKKTCANWDKRTWEDSESVCLSESIIPAENLLDKSEGKVCCTKTNS